MGHQPQLQILYWRTQSMTIWSRYLYHDGASLEELLVWNEDVNDATHAFPLAYCTGSVMRSGDLTTTIHIQLAMKDSEGEHKTRGISSVLFYNWMAKIEDSYGLSHFVCRVYRGNYTVCHLTPRWTGDLKWFCLSCLLLDGSDQSWLPLTRDPCPSMRELWLLILPALISSHLLRQTV